jgi:nucleoside-diphosphate-sugar epimerase
VTVVVTGAAGLLGRHVVAALLEAGREVRAVDVVAPPASGAELVRADLTSFGETVQALQGATAVVHAAGIPRPTGVTGVDLFRTNVLASWNVVEAAVLHRVPRLANASSFSMLGLPFNPRPIVPAYLPIDEAHPTQSQETYALTKQVTEDIVSSATRGSDLTAISLRMPWIQTSETFARAGAPRRDDPAIGVGSLWAYIDARDAARMFVAALERPVEGHAAVYVSAEDTFMDVPTPTLIERTFGGIDQRMPLVGFATVIDTRAADRLLGVRPAYSWRSYPPGASV